MIFEKMSGVKVTPQYIQEHRDKIIPKPLLTAQKIDSPKPSRFVSTSDEHKDVMKSLLKLGFYRSQAKAAIDKVNSYGKIYEGDEFFQEVLNTAYGVEK